MDSSRQLSKKTPSHDDDEGQQQQQQLQQQRRTVLTEEEYSASLSKVIQRNYFPDLPQLEAQVALQNARDGGDFGRVIATRRAARRLQQHEEEARAQEAHNDQDALDDDNNGTGLRKRPRPLEHESVTGFHARVTSQDNAEYETVQKEEQTQRQQERWHATQTAMNLLMAGNSSSSNNNNKTTKQQRSPSTPLMLASDQFNPSPHRSVLTRAETERASLKQNPLFFPPAINEDDGSSGKDVKGMKLLEWKGTESSERESNQPKDEAAMPPPELQPTTATALVVDARRSSNNKALSLSTPTAPVEYIPKNQQPQHKRIVPSATRFPVVVVAAARRNHNPSLQDAVDDASSTRTTTDYTTDGSSVSTDLDETPRHSLQTERTLALKRQKREQETLVAMTPIIVPGQARGGEEDDDNDNEPIMTWGEVSSTPLVISGSTEAGGGGRGPTFKMAEETSRDAAAGRALETLQKRGRRAAAAASTPKPLIRSSKTRPSASSALQQQQKRRSTKTTTTTTASPMPAARSSSAFGSALRASYARPPNSSSRNRRPHTTSSRLRPSTTQNHRTAHAATPKLLHKSASL